MARYHQATSHHLSQCWSRSMSPYGVTRPFQQTFSVLFSCVKNAVLSLKFDPKGLINNKPALVQIMAWCQTGKGWPSFELMIRCCARLLWSLQQSWKGGTLFFSPCPFVHLSVRQNCVRSVSSTILVGSNFRRCVACKVCFKIEKFWHIL